MLHHLQGRREEGPELRLRHLLLSRRWKKGKCRWGCRVNMKRETLKHMLHRQGIIILTMTTMTTQKVTCTLLSHITIPSITLVKQNILEKKLFFPLQFLVPFLFCNVLRTTIISMKYSMIHKEGVWYGAAQLLRINCILFIQGDKSDAHNKCRFQMHIQVLFMSVHPRWQIYSSQWIFVSACFFFFKKESEKQI